MLLTIHGIHFFQENVILNFFLKDQLICLKIFRYFFEVTLKGSNIYFCSIIIPVPIAHNGFLNPVEKTRINKCVKLGHKFYAISQLAC